MNGIPKIFTSEEESTTTRHTKGGILLHRATKLDLGGSD